MVDMIAGRISFMLVDPVQAMQHVTSQRLRAIAVGSPKPLPLLPNVPTATESGLPGFEATVWWGLLVPAKTPRNVVAKLNAETNKALGEAASVKDKLAEMGAITAPGTPEQFGDFIGAETEKWATVHPPRRHQGGLSASPSPQTASSWRTPSLSMSAPAPRWTISPRSMTRYWSASDLAKS